MRVKKIPIRQCGGCGEHLPKKQLIRVVRTPEGAVTVDFVGKVSGRGVYICPKSSCFKKARKSKRFERELGCPISEELYDTIENAIREKEQAED